VQCSRRSVAAVTVLVHAGEVTQPICLWSSSRRSTWSSSSLRDQVVV